MKKAYMIIVIIGCCIGILGSLFTFFSGGMLGYIYENADGTIDSTFGGWMESGFFSFIFILLALASGIIGGVSKKRFSILIFALISFIAGILNFKYGNWFSGIIIIFGSILGLLAPIFYKK